MTTIGIPNDIQTDIFRVPPPPHFFIILQCPQMLAAILHVGNIRFQGDTPADVCY